MSKKEEQQQPSKPSSPSSEAPIIQQEGNSNNNIHTSFENIMEVYNILNDGTIPPSSSSVKTAPLNLSERKDSTKATALKNRKVMVPMTTQAFFRGTLQPHMISTKKDKKENSNPKKEEEEEEESVMLNLGQNYYAQVSKSKACDILAQRMEKIILSTETKSSKDKEDGNVVKKKSAGATKKKKKAEIKKEKIEPPAQQSEQKPKNSVAVKQKQELHETITTTTTTTTEEALPFFEIREHYDDQNKEVRSEVINMTNEIKHLKEKVASKGKKRNGNDEEGKDDMAEVSKNVQEELDDMMSSMQSTTLNTASMEETANVEENQQQENDGDDEEAKYQKISARLDELIQLEENSEKNKRENIKSSKKLQSKSWNKGFLNQSAKKKKKTKKVSSTATSTSVSEKAPLPSAAASTTTTKVSFREENEVKEIPRIGTSSLPPKNNSGNPTTKQKKKPQPIPIDQHVFTGVVSERSVKPQPQPSLTSFDSKTSNNVLHNSNVMQDYSMGGMTLGGVREQPLYGQQQQVGENHAHDVEQTQQEQQPKKKLSRFAQRRQQQRMS